MNLQCGEDNSMACAASHRRVRIRTSRLVPELKEETGMAVVHGAERPQVIEIPNGARATAMFSAGEMERRLSGLRGLMATLDVEATLFTSIHNINYFADFLYCSFGRAYGLV